MSGYSSQPLVSVIVPTYNRAHLIGRTLASILGQTHKNLELIVADDAGEDDTFSVVKGLRDPRLKYTKREQNRGLAAARNFGSRHATGDFIAFCDDDDVWLLDKLERQLRHFARHPESKICYTASFHVLPDGRKVLLWGRKVDTKTLLIKGQSMLSSLMRIECLTKAGGFDESLPVCEDYEMWLRLSMLYPIDYLDVPLVEISLRAETMSTDERKLAQYNIEIAEKKIAELLASRSRLLSPQDLREAQSAVAFRKGKFAFFDRSYPLARELFRASRRLDPFNLRALVFLPFCALGVDWFYRILPLYEKLFGKKYAQYG